MNLTGWFPANVKPVRVGVYMQEHASTGWLEFSYWTGKYWCIRRATVEEALQSKGRPSAFQRNRRWQGVTDGN